MTLSPSSPPSVEVPAMNDFCEDCRLRPATVRVRYPSDFETFRVCDRCAQGAEGGTATVLTLIEGGAS